MNLIQMLMSAGITNTNVTSPVQLAVTMLVLTFVIVKQDISTQVLLNALVSLNLYVFVSRMNKMACIVANFNRCINLFIFYLFIYTRSKGL